MMISSRSPRDPKWRDDWQTPPELLEVIREHAPIGLDPATAPDNPTGAAAFCTEQNSGLERPWHDCGFTFVNPPYSTTKLWIAKAADEAEHGAEIAMLIPSRPGTRYWEPCFSADLIVFLRGRLKFLDASTGKPALDANGRETGAQFESALVYWGKRPERFARASGHLGWCVRPRKRRRAA